MHQFEAAGLRRRRELGNAWFDMQNKFGQKERV
jgi:hypothetical protein